MFDNAQNTACSQSRIIDSVLRYVLCEPRSKSLTQCDYESVLHCPGNVKSVEVVYCSCRILELR